MYSGELITEATGDSRRYVCTELHQIPSPIPGDVQAIRRIWPNVSIRPTGEQLRGGRFPHRECASLKPSFTPIADRIASSSLDSWFVFPQRFHSHVMNFSTESQLRSELLDEERRDQRAHQAKERSRPFHARSGRGEPGVAFFLLWKPRRCTCLPSYLLVEGGLTAE